ncbi:MAG: nucleotidyltransferase family protein [Ignavibacteriales bacterium]
MGGVAAIVVAAGTSSRMGTPKQLLSWHGEPLLKSLVRQVLAARVDPVIVVLGHRQEEISGVLEPLIQAAGGRLKTVFNAGYLDGGQASSVRTGARALPADAAGAVLLPSDMPLIGATHVDALVSTYEEARKTRGDYLVVVATYGSRRGHPVLFGSALLEDLARAPEDQGARVLVYGHPERVIEVPAGEEVVLDIDTWEDYERLKAR